MPGYSVLAAQMAASFHIEGRITKGTGDTIEIPPLSLNIGGRGYHLGATLILNPLQDNDGSFAYWSFGQDYYIYAAWPAEFAIAPRLLVSLNSTVPFGYTMDNSRKIGGFHYGKVRTGTAANAVTDSIVPNSVWDLRHRPTCSPEGMVEVGNIWVDIYLASDDGQGGLRSAYNATPLTGTEGLNWYSFIERATKVGKRLPSYAEWIAAAQGSPQGLDDSNTNAWTATANTGRNPTGLVANATSAYNCRDCVGNVYEWVDETSIRFYTNDHNFNWHDVMPGYGHVYMQTQYADRRTLRSIVVGGRWDVGAKGGARTTNLNYAPWSAQESIGCRAVCDSLDV